MRIVFLLRFFENVISESEDYVLKMYSVSSMHTYVCFSFIAMRRCNARLVRWVSLAPRSNKRVIYVVVQSFWNGVRNKRAMGVAQVEL